MNRNLLRLKIVTFTILPFLFCSCQCYTRQEISDIPKSINGIIMVHCHATDDELKMYAETAIELYNSDKIIGVVIVAEDNERNVLYSHLAESNLKNNVDLNVKPGSCPIKVLSGIGDVLGYSCSYTIISKHRLIWLKEIIM